MAILWRLIVVGELVRHRSDDRDLARDAGSVLQQLTQSHTRNGCRNRLERPAIFRDRIRFWIPKIEMARAALKHDVDCMMLPRHARSARSAFPTMADAPRDPVNPPTTPKSPSGDGNTEPERRCTISALGTDSDVHLRTKRTDGGQADAKVAGVLSTGEWFEDLRKFIRCDG